MAVPFTPLNSDVRLSVLINMYEKQWENYRFRLNLLWFSLFSFILFFIVVVLFHNASFMKFIGHYLATYLMIIWFLLNSFSGFWLQAFKCPRCKKYYFRKTVLVPVLGFSISLFSMNLFTKNCLNCNLPKWSNDPNAGNSNQQSNHKLQRT
jgi:hypothetical protein